MFLSFFFFFFAFFSENWVLTEDYCKKDPCNCNTEMFVSKVGQPMSNSWSTSSQPDFVQALARRKTARNPPRKMWKLLPATGVIWALRAQKWQRDSEISSAPKKSKTESKKSQNRQFLSYFDSFSTPFWAFWAPVAERPRELISDSLCHFGPEGPK